MCEDSVFVKETESSVFGVIADGCSTGINSAWASQTMCYFIQDVLNKHNDITSKHMWLQGQSQLRFILRLLGLNEMNFLTTALLFHYKKDTKILTLRLFGDGVYYINGVEYVINQNNTPDYLAYYLDNPDFYQYLEKYPELVYENVDSFQICSDGIESFSISQFEQPKKHWGILLENPTSENYLKRMFNILTKDKWIINDDLSIVSYVNQSE